MSQFCHHVFISFLCVCYKFSQFVGNLIFPPVLKQLWVFVNLGLMTWILMCSRIFKNSILTLILKCQIILIFCL